MEQPTGRTGVLTPPAQPTAPTTQGLPPPAAQISQSHDLLQSLLYMQAAEYYAVCSTVYNAASDRLEQARDDTTWTAVPQEPGTFETKPAAVVLDVDETALLTVAYKVALVLAQYKARLALTGIDGVEQFWNQLVILCAQYQRYLLDQVEQNDSSWKLWSAFCQQGDAPAVPGAAEFATRAHELGIKVIYVTNRSGDLRDCTTANLRARGFPVDDDCLIMADHDGWADKEQRRAAIADKYRVLMLAGDSLGDFVAGDRCAPSERTALAKRHREAWGRTLIAVPNPVYGAWENSLYDFSTSLTEAEKTQKRLEHLDPRPMSPGPG